MPENKMMTYIELAKTGAYEVCIWGAGYIGRKRGLDLLKKRGIKIDWYCDNNIDLWDKEITDGIICISPSSLQQKKGTVICFVMVGVNYCDSVVEQLNDMHIEQIVMFNDLIEEEVTNYFPFMKRKQIAVYTCIVGDYDTLQEPPSISEDCDYFLISDKIPRENSIFQYLDVREIVPKHITDPTRVNRYCKINAHTIFPQYRYSIYFDGNIGLKSSITDFINKLPVTRIIAFCPNYWKSIYREMISILESGRDNEQIVKKQAESYWLEGMPDDFGCLMCGILIREHNNPVCRKLMDEWWIQIEQFSKRDQVSLPYVLWKNGYSISDVGIIEDKYNYLEGGKYWTFEKEHNKPRNKEDYFYS